MEEKGPSTSKKAIKWVGFIIFLILVVSLVRSVLRITGSYASVENARSKLDDLRALQSELSQELAELNTDFYVEKEARDKLGYAKSGEVILVLPEEEILKRLSPLAGEADVLTLPDPIWMRWVNVFN